MTALTSASGAAKPRLHTLTSLRFFACYAVVILHLLPNWLYVGYTQLPQFILNILDSAYVGLPFFYALSGFVLFYVYQSDVPDTFRKRMVFMGKRFARLAPVFYLSLLLGFGPVLWQNIQELGEVKGAVISTYWLVANGLFLSAWLPHTLPINFPTWSISVEMSCYLFFPFLLPLVLRCSRRQCFAGLVFCFLTGAVIQWAGVWYNPDLYGWPFRAVIIPQWVTNFFQLNPIVHAPEFLFGVLLARVWHLAKDQGRGHGDIWLVAGVGLVTLALQSGIDWPFLMITSFLFLPLLGMILWGGACVRSPYLRWLEYAPVVLLGESTYVMYTMHIPLNTLFRKTTIGQHVNVWEMAGFLVFLTVFSILVHLYFERPLRRLIAGWFQHRYG